MTELEDFPDANLVPLVGEIRGFQKIAGTWQKSDAIDITIPLRPFRLQKLEAADGVTEKVSTAVRLEDVPLLVASLADLENRRFSFPPNPEPGYVDASVYLRSAHSPIEIRELRFGTVLKDARPRIEVRETMKLCLDLERTGLRNRDAVLSAQLRVVSGPMRVVALAIRGPSVPSSARGRARRRRDRS